MAGLSPETAAAVTQAAQLVAAARAVVALTGAGVSVESGIPPFRGPGGLWTKYGEPPLDGYQRFLRDPAAAWRQRLHPEQAAAATKARGDAAARVMAAPELRAAFARAQPNAGHKALAALEKAGACTALITQNIDGLHARAGHQNVLEIHGNNSLLRCLECHARFAPEQIHVDENALPPRCPRGLCGGIIKEDTVSFGEPIPPDVLQGCAAATARCDLMLVVGTSATVYPAAAFPEQVLQRGGALVEVNPHASELSPRATISLRGAAGAVLQALLAEVRRRQGAAQ